jgi:hypothetical protein
MVLVSPAPARRATTGQGRKVRSGGAERASLVARLGRECFQRKRGSFRRYILGAPRSNGVAYICSRKGCVRVTLESSWRIRSHPQLMPVWPHRLPPNGQADAADDRYCRFDTRKTLVFASDHRTCSGRHQRRRHQRLRGSCRCNVTKGVVPTCIGRPRGPTLPMSWTRPRIGGASKYSIDVEAPPSRLRAANPI